MRPDEVLLDRRPHVFLHRCLATHQPRGDDIERDPSEDVAHVAKLAARDVGGGFWTGAPLLGLTLLFTAYGAALVVRASGVLVYVGACLVALGAAKWLVLDMSAIVSTSLAIAEGRQRRIERRRLLFAS